MCGVFCLFLNRPLADSDIALGRAGTTALAHRGPDGEGEWTDRKDGVFLGHRRLAIIDPSPASDQPMQRDGNVITYNGEIYNFRQLRQTLQAKGIRFQTNGDVEVIFRAWQTWLDEMFCRLDGIFAFAFWDGHRGVVATDAFGEKPLFYAETDDGLYFSSEIRPLAQLLGLPPSMDEVTLAAYLALGFIPPPRTAFEKIRRVSAAKRLIIEHGKIVDEKTYWQPPISEIGRGPMEPLSSAHLDAVATALNIRPRDLIVTPLDPSEAVVVAKIANTGSRAFPDTNSPQYRFTYLARTRHQPEVKGFEVAVLGDDREKGRVRHGLHEYVYNYGDAPVVFWWGENRAEDLAPGDSAYIRPMASRVPRAVLMGTLL